MNGLLAIAEAFMDRMTNPRYGPDVNEEYALRFSQAMADDPAFATAFASMDLDGDDVSSLPTCAWPWYLEWRRLADADPPPAGFLDALFTLTDDPGMRLAVTRSALSDRPGTTPAGTGPDAAGTAPVGTASTVGAGADLARLDAPQGERASIGSRWLRSRVSRMVEAGDPADAIEIATYLLQLGDPESIASLAALLRTDWPGRRALQDAIRQQLSDANLDQESAADWYSRLGLGDDRDGS